MSNFPDPNFWRNLLTSKKKETPRREFTQECWDRAAETYDDLENEPDYAKQVERVTEKMTARGIFGAHRTLIDIACGTGTYGLIFARHVKRVTGIDISNSMLERFREKARARGIENLEIIHADWHSLDLSNKYDIVFSSMNPLLGDYKNIDRMLDISRRYLVLVGWAGIRRNMFLERIGKKILGHALRAPKSDITVVFCYLYSLGYSPEIEYFTGTWRRTYELERQLERIVWRLEFERDLTPDEKAMVRKELKKISENGHVTLETRIRTGMILLDKG